MAMTKADKYAWRGKKIEFLHQSTLILDIQC